MNSSNIFDKVTNETPPTEEPQFTLEFLFNRGKSEPSTISGLPRSEVNRFATEELIGWLAITEEEAIRITNSIVGKIDAGSGRKKHTYVFPEGETFTIINESF